MVRWFDSRELLVYSPGDADPKIRPFLDLKGAWHDFKWIKFMILKNSLIINFGLLRVLDLLFGLHVSRLNESTMCFSKAGSGPWVAPVQAADKAEAGNGKGWIQFGWIKICARGPRLIRIYNKRY